MADPIATEVHISSLLLTVHPDRTAAVAAAVPTVAGAEVAITDPTGKIIVTLETAGEGAITAALNRLQTLPGVVSAALVFHQIADDDPDHADGAATEEETSWPSRAAS